jgi:hypothetical protein
MSETLPARLVWGIRTSFREYVAALEDGRFVVDGAEADEDGFAFPRSVDGAFGGRVRITAHGGALDVTLADPRIEPDGTRVVLTADTGDGRLALVRLLDVADATTFAEDGGVAADVALTIEGAAWLGGVYNPWARMDPVRVVRA